MFTSLSLLKSYPVPQVDRNAMLWYLRRYADTAAGMWLKTIHYSAMEYKYCWGMRGGIMGAWLSLLKNRVYLMPEYADADPMEFFANPIGRTDNTHPAALSNWAALIVSTAVHELRHKYQRRRLGVVLYTLCTLPGLRAITLERDAHRIWKHCEPFMQKWNAMLTENEFLRRMNATGKEAVDERSNT